MSQERIQKTFTLSFNSRISSDLKMLAVLQSLPKGYGKRLFQDLMEEKFGKPHHPDFEKNVLRFLDLDDYAGAEIRSNRDTEALSKEKNHPIKSPDSLEV